MPCLSTQTQTSQSAVHARRHRPPARKRQHVSPAPEGSSGDAEEGREKRGQKARAESAGARTVQGKAYERVLQLVRRQGWGAAGEASGGRTAGRIGDKKTTKARESRGRVTSKGRGCVHGGEGLGEEGKRGSLGLDEGQRGQRAEDRDSQEGLEGWRKKEWLSRAPSAVASAHVAVVLCRIAVPARPSRAAFITALPRHSDLACPAASGSHPLPPLTVDISPLPATSPAQGQHAGGGGVPQQQSPGVPGKQVKGWVSGWVGG